MAKKNNHKAMSSSDSEDDVPLSSLKMKKTVAGKKKKRKAISSSESSSDSDDDIPLASLSKKMTKAPAKRKKVVRKSKKSPAKTKRNARSNSSKKAISVTTEDSYDTIIRSARYCSKKTLNKVLTKAHVVDGILIRWQYAFQWIYKGDKSPEPGFLMLRGFPGVFLGCKGDHIGQLKDKRDWNCDLLPTSSHLSKRPGAELKELLIKAIEGQIQDLLENEPRQNEKERLKSQLEEELIRVKRIDPAKLK